MFCKYCGTEIEEKSGVCPSCGAFNIDTSSANNDVNSDTSSANNDVNSDTSSANNGVNSDTSSANNDVNSDTSSANNGVSANIPTSNGINNINLNSVPKSNGVTSQSNYKSLITLCGAFLAILIIIQIFSMTKTTKYEYTTVSFDPTQYNSRQGTGSSNYSTINISDDVLNQYGSEGWEIVSSYLETETAFPNFGNDEYVTGIRSNVRPQKLVVIFKRPIGLIK